MDVHKLVASCGFILPILLGLTACEDPSSVGLGLVGDEGGAPVVSTMPFSHVALAPEPGLRDNTGQVLVGVVDDPTLGPFQATGYVDFQINTSQPEAYRNGVVDAAILRLENTYVYGDTLQEITLALHEALAEYSATGSTLDSLPPLGPEITRFSFLPTESVVSAPLPADWVAAHDATLRSTQFAAEFHGFQLVPVSGNAIVGFANVVASASDLRSIVGSDTVDFGAVKSITRFEREGDAPALPGRLVTQNGLGPRLHLNFDLTPFAGNAVNRANLRLRVDTLALAPAPNFVRPAVTEMSLYGITQDSVSVLLDVGSVDQNAFLDFDSESFRSVVQALVLDAEPFDRYELRFPVTGGNTVNALVMFDTTAVEAAPSVVLTTTPLN